MASGPMSARRRSRRTAMRICLAAFSGLVVKARSMSLIAVSGSRAGSRHAGIHACVARDVRLDASGVDRRHRDGGALDLQLHAQRVAEAPDRKLGGVIGRLGGHADEAEDTGDVHDMPLAGLLQSRQECLGPVHHAPEVDVHQPFEILVGHRLDGCAERNARVVEDEVDPTVFGDDVVGPRIHRIVGCDVEVCGRDLHPEAVARRHSLGEPRVINVTQGQVRPAPSQRVGEGPADARAGPGDRRDTVAKIPHRLPSAVMC